MDAALGVPLPPDYRHLLLHYGVGMPLEPYINWYRPADPSGFRGLIEENANRPVPHLIYILSCGYGDNFALDTTRRAADSEPVVVLADHETCDEKTAVVAANLAEFIYRWAVQKDDALLRLA